MENAIYIGLWAWLWCSPLTEPGKIFGWFKSIVYRLLTKGGHDIEEGWRQYIWLPVVGCSTCHAGQVAFWFMVFNWQGFGFAIKFLILALITAEFTSRTAHFLKHD